MREKLVALALIRAAITEDLDTLQVLIAENPPTPGLVADLVTLAAGILEQGCGRERAVQAVDGWLRTVLAETTR